MIIGKGLGIQKYKLKFKALPPSFHGTKLAFLTDLHGKSYGEDNSILFAFIDEEKPDFILVGGDMVVGGVTSCGKSRKASKPSVHTALNLLERLSKTHPIYHALGNHEEKLETSLFREYYEALLRFGVHFLDNEKVKLTSKKGEMLSLYGLSLERDYFPKLKRRKLPLEEMEKKIGKKEEFSILMAHSPLYFATYKDWGADLTLSGHFHGGIMRLPFLGGLLGPDFIPFPKYSGGLFSEGEKRMVVSCGLGTHTIHLRVFNPPELTIIELEVGE